MPNSSEGLLQHYISSKTRCTSTKARAFPLVPAEHVNSGQGQGWVGKRTESGLNGEDRKQNGVVPGVDQALEGAGSVAPVCAVSNPLPKPDRRMDQQRLSPAI